MDDIVGIIRAYSPSTRTARVELRESLRVGDVVRVDDGSRVFEQPITDLQADDDYADRAQPGQRVAFRVSQPVGRDAQVFVVRHMRERA